MAVTRWEAFSVTDGWIGFYLPSGNLSHSCSSTRWISNFRWMPHTTVNSTLMVSAGCEEKRVDFKRRKIWKWIPLRVNGEKHAEIPLLQRARKPSGTRCLSRNSVHIPHPCTGKKWGRWEDQDAPYEEKMWDFNTNRGFGSFATLLAFCLGRYLFYFNEAEGIPFSLFKQVCNNVFLSGNVNSHTQSLRKTSNDSSMLYILLQF